MDILSNWELTKRIKDLARKCKCSSIDIIDVLDVVPDLTQTNTFQILSNGEVWFVACNGESVQMDSGATVVVSTDPNNDITVGTDGGAFLDVSVFDTNFFVTNLAQNANRTHDQANFTTTINNVNSFTFDRGAATLLDYFRFDAAGLDVQTSTIQFNASTSNYILGDGAGLFIPPTEAVPDWVLLVDAATGSLEKIAPCVLVDDCLGISGGGNPALFLNEQGNFVTTGSETETISANFEGGGSPVSAGLVWYVYVPYASIITAATMFSDIATTAVIDVWVDSRANYPPVNADSITAAAPPTLTTAVISHNTTLTGWTIVIPADSFVGFNVDSNDLATLLGISLTVVKT